MDNKTVAIITVSLIFTGLFGYLLLTSHGEEAVLDRITYNYTGLLWIPPASELNSSLGGYYKIWGQGRDFNFIIKLPGAEKAESPLDYTEDGLNGTGRIKTIDITYDTIYNLYSGNIKKAMFDTRYTGDFDMKCAAWTGYGNFSSMGGENISGNFIINGPMTYWDGTFTLKYENRIILEMNYILHPKNNPSDVRKGSNIIYM